MVMFFLYNLYILKTKFKFIATKYSTLSICLVCSIDEANVQQKVQVGLW